jgi:sugar phosphate isomerase/epimerase
MYTRREFGMLTLAGLALPRLAEAAIDSRINGVRVGAQTYCFRDLPRSPNGDAIQGIVSAMTACGLGECELFAPQAEPAPLRGRPAADSAEARKAREELRAWRLHTPLDHWRGIRKKFNEAGIAIYAYNYSFNMSFSDAEIDRGFEMAKALGAEIITASATLDAAKRVAPFAAKHQMVVAMHNHSRVDEPNEFATPESFTAAMKMSKFFKINLDIGHFTAANYDAVAFIRQHHADITNLHLKDRRKGQGENVSWGDGDTPIRAVLQLLKNEKWPIRAYIEYEYKGAASPVEETRKCFAYAKQALLES